MAKKKKLNQYELITTKTGVNMPFAVRGKDRVSTLKFVKKRLRKGEKIVSLKKA